DGVQEVAYIHSNQNVVGSSKAENHLSRWAVRDVFELKQFSQLPANVAVCSAKVKRYFWKYAEDGRKRMLSWKSNKLLRFFGVFSGNKYPITHWPNIFFLLDNYRRQFEEMVSHFNMRSVKDLAEHIANATSETRRKMLKDFYVSKHPEMESFFSLEVPAEASHNCEGRELGTTHSRKRKSIVNFGRSKSRPSSVNRLLLSGTAETQTQESHKEAEQLRKNSCLQDIFVDAKYKQSPTVATQCIQRRNSQAFKDFMASGSLSSKSEIIEVLPVKNCEGQPDSEGTQLPKKRSLSQSENGERKAQICKKNSFVDLLGDTSILDEVFRNDGSGSTGSLRRFSSGQAEKSKGRPKDFWDMLNEQNEESLIKLTDIAVIEKICERTPHSTVTEEREVCESSLWKRNETFLWKKYSADD
ncbi:ER6L2 protein, partial [Rhadina sibilatrix]|nr:ER6L2 protein [Rhadina sibilatrix]